MDNSHGGILKTYKYAVFSEIATSFVHEMKNPISAITLGMEFFDMSLAEGDPQKETLRSIYKSSEKLNALLDNLLVYCQNGNFEKTPFKISQVARQAVSLVNYFTTRHQVKVEITEALQEPWITSRASLVLQGLVYLMVWSAKRMPQGGKIIIEILSGGQSVILKFHDQGPVLNAGQRDRIMNPELPLGPNADDLGPQLARRLFLENGAEFNLNAGQPKAPLFSVKFSNQ
ncbi:HAMP domain-containing histidine kinase [candidate division TA06 bacterium]|uniref:HAMP domain-containing histidine kinase n=1 Tax=candidate division TA06 bacterium TaxID=2250710 RepID=A0A933MKE4_UNCT6|nr:HAMP domain-containing histidine kinase [candidate division TA06 bacterium]